jgi:hypothetical protein
MLFHMQKASVKTGDTVKRGQTIGLVGTTGRATGPHLHLGFRWLNQRIDPLLLLNAPKLLPDVVDSAESAQNKIDHAESREPPEKDNAFVMNGFAKLAKYAPKLRRFLTSPCRRDLLGGPQTWCPIAPDLATPLARERQRLGEEFWLYVCMNPKFPYAT